MPTLDIFKKDGFSLTSLTASVNKLPFVPGAASKTGIFDTKGVSTLTIEVEMREGRIVLIANSERGSAAKQNTRDSRNLRYFKTAHLKLADRIMADEIQGKRKFGTDSELVTAQDEVAERQIKMLKSHDATVEYGRIGAIKGLIYDANGTTLLYDLFNEFGVAQQAVDFALGTATTDIIEKCTEVREKIQDALGAEGSDDLEVTMFCGKTWFNKFIKHAKVAEAYKFYQTTQANMNPLQVDLRYKGFKFGDITFVVYRGNVSGVPFVNANEAHAFATNVPSLFITRYAPADYMETVNTEGLPRYSKMAFDVMYNRWVEVETQSNPISLCTRPETLLKATTSN